MRERREALMRGLGGAGPGKCLWYAPFYCFRIAKCRRRFSFQIPKLSFT
jgi:hypothetical protein